LRSSAVALAAFVPLAVGGVAQAGDFAHYCRSADGAYVMGDEELRFFDVSKGSETGPALRYRVLGKYELRRNEGYCVSVKDPDRRRYKYQGSTYSLHVSFRHRGQSQKAYMICEKASSGLPAMYNCDREVKTLEWTASPQVPTRTPPKTRSRSRTKPEAQWSHDGSGIRIVAQGRKRQLVYVSPRAALREAGVRSGDMLFEGRREGDRYIGKAYSYSRRCGSVAYQVRGRIRNGERLVVVRGRKPVRDCAIVERRHVRLEFERNR